jgi:hypothetical protein
LSRAVPPGLNPLTPNPARIHDEPNGIVVIEVRQGTDLRHQFRIDYTGESPIISEASA